MRRSGSPASGPRSLALLHSLICAAWLAAVPVLAAQQDTAHQPVELDTLRVVGKRPVTVGPIPGLQITKEMIPGNVQSVTGLEIRRSQAVSLNDFLNQNLQSINVNDYQGNPFQMDVTFRGFSASPQIGTPQGISVFFDGTRVNEPFGDVVNWDLIPLNAIAGLDLYSGSNPLFGLNTLGGALALRTRSGFTDKGVEGQATGGQWGRKQAQVAAGGSKGRLAGFVAGTWFEESGWRDDSHSKVQQFFGRGDWATSFGVITGSALLAHNNLIGNGLIPLSMYQRRAESVFSSPDQTRNNLAQFTLDGLFPTGKKSNITAHLYRRNSDRDGVNGDIYEDFQDFDLQRDVALPEKPDSVRWCKYADTDGDGRPDGFQPAGFDPLFGTLTNCWRPTPIGSRNGASEFGVSHGSGVEAGTPTGLWTKTSVDQLTHGAAAQFNFNGDKHHFMMGASIDASTSKYAMGQQLGLINEQRRVFLAPDQIDSVYRAAQVEIHGNDFNGKQHTASVYANETWSPRSNLHITFAARFNSAYVRNHMNARGDEGNVPLSELRNKMDPYILCPEADVSSCPDAPVHGLKDLSNDSIAPTRESHTYNSFNPAIGLTWQVRPLTTVYANFSRGARSPSSIELGCAFDPTPVLINPEVPAWGYQPRSLSGPTCTLPTTLSGDPYLPQIRSTSWELGARGQLGANWEWNSTIYRTDLDDDLYFVGVAGGRSYFDNVGETRRQGLELGLSGKLGKFSVRSGYGYTDAAFMSTFYMLSPNNSSADFDQNSRTVWGVGDEVGQFGHHTLPTPGFFANRGYGTFLMIKVQPGARIPGVPLHNINLGVDFQATRGLRFGANMVARSSSYLRGNENNLHQDKGTDQQIGQYYCPTFQIEDPNCHDGYLQLPVVPGRPFFEKGTVPGFAVFNFNASWAVTPAFTISALVNNIFDAEYYTAGRLGLNPFSPSTQGVIGPSGWNYNSSEWQNSTLVGPSGPRGLWVTLNYAIGSSANAQ